MRKQLFITGSVNAADGSENGGLSSMQFRADSHLVGIDVGNYDGLDMTLIMKVKWNENHFDDGDPNADDGWDLMAYGETTASSSVQCGVDVNKQPSIQVWDNDGSHMVIYGDLDDNITFAVGGDGWCTYAVSLSHYYGGLAGSTFNDFLFAPIMSIDEDMGTDGVPPPNLTDSQALDSNPTGNVFVANRNGPFSTPEIWIGCGFAGVGHTGGVPSGTAEASLRIYDIMLINGRTTAKYPSYADHISNVPDDPSIDPVVYPQPTPYNRAVEVVNWWRPGYDRDNIGKDYIGTADLTVVNLDASDIRVDAP